MPVLDGYETCRQLRATPGLEQAKILLVSSQRSAAERIDGYAAGADDYVTKPFEGAELLAKIRVYLRLKRVEEMELLKSGILDLMAHEIRTPLTAILPATEMLNGDYNLTADDRRMLVSTIREGAQRLLRLTERATVLHQARHGSLQLRRQALDLGTAVAAAGSSTRVSVVGGDSAPVFADRRLLSLAIEELFNHACNNNDGQLVAKVLGADQNGWVRLRISSGEDGATATEAVTILAPLSAEVRGGQTVGAYLGLPTAQAIVAAHGGKLFAATADAAPWCLEVCLPAHHAVASADPARAVHAGAPARSPSLR
jgi:K+-sensing histidine kinase KdpD